MVTTARKHIGSTSTACHIGLFNYLDDHCTLEIASCVLNDLSILDEGSLCANLHVRFFRVKPPFSRLRDVGLPVRVSEHVADVLKISGPVDGCRVIRSHIPAPGGSTLALLQVLLELLLQTARGEVLCAEIVTSQHQICEI